MLAGFIILAIFFGGPLHLSQLPLSIQHLTSLPMFYYLGYCLSKYEEISIFTRKSRMTAIIILLSYIIYYAFYLNEGLTGGVTKDISIATFLRYVNAFAMTIVLFEFTKHLIEYGNKRVRDLGQNSLYIYLLHTYFLAVIAILLKKLSITSTFLILVALFLGAMLLSLFSVKIIKSVKILDKLFTGKLVK
ncbi:acyltransferase family protein [Streptococcus porci]|uniref:acyltransferase family protein n=1 Tax=Streptococcus porci TaxID=502567 RepID=UPI000417F636|nr:acyltransferase family protein [Streptococcus porci]